MALGKKGLAGLLISAASAQAILAITIAQSLYPGYSVLQALSDLGVGVTAPIFNVSLVILGVLFIASAYYIKKSFGNIYFALLQAVVGIAAAGVGLFPETTGLPHDLFAITAFLIGSIIVMLSSRLVKGQIGYFFIVLGIISLASLLFGLLSKNYLGLGFGGMERLVFYPLVIWGLLFGGYLLAAPEKSKG